MPEFLAENNLCGQTILNLVSGGNAIIAELLRLKDFIPKLYITESKAEILKYQDIISDFSYFDVTEAQEAKIRNNEILRDLDEEFRDNHIDIITRFYELFESIHSFVNDLNQFLEDLEEGIYIHQTLETIFADIEGKQLLCESLFLYGLMLLFVDTHIKGIVREKLLVSYYRYTPQSSNARSNIDDVCKLFRDTGIHTRKVTNYPEDYFRRIKINSTYVDMVLGHLRTDDVYGQLQLYPLPKHRSTALSSQAAMLYVCLYFSPDILHSHTAVMREIVDKYFPDNWNISIYMGYVVDLIESWDAFKAAKMALNNTLETVNVKNVCKDYATNTSVVLRKCMKMLTEGNITKEVILKDMNHIITLLRECNVILRWLMLHTYTKPGKIEKNKRSKQIREMITSETKYDQVQTFRLLLNTAQLELTVKELFKNILSEKEKQWNKLKNDSFKDVVELSEAFSGSKPLSRITKNKNLEKWFLEISKQIDSLVLDDTNSSRKIVQLIQALEEVQTFHQLESNMQVIQILGEIKLSLNQMIQTMSIKEDNLITIQVLGDISFAWELIDSYTPIMQLGIKKEPTVVNKLRAIFLKLASAMEIPLLRINQAHSKDLISVSEYYSGELEIYVRKVLQIIPMMMFGKMSRIIEMQTKVLKELPTRLEKDKLKEYAQLDERFEYAELTHSISVFSQGMRMMKKTLVGVVFLDPKKILEDGIRNELVQRISKALHEVLIFSSKSKTELEQKLNTLGNIMEGYKKSFEYIQDYININGLKIWQEEITRIINYNVEQECNRFLRSKVHAWDSQYQSRIIPIPFYLQTDSISENFIGRLAREMIRLTDPRNSVYLDQSTAWYETKSHKPILNRQIFGLLTKAIEISGVVGLDRLFSFMIITNLQKTIGYLQNKHEKQPTWYSIISTVQKDIKSAGEVSNPPKFYQNCVNRTARLWPEFLDCILIIGQLQLLRQLIAFHLNLLAKFNARNLEAALQSLSKALLWDIKYSKDWTPDEKLLQNLSHYFDYAGINNPFNKIYVTSSSHLDYTITIFVFFMAHNMKLFHPGVIGNLGKRASDQLDGYCFCLGIHTVLKQAHNSLNDNFIKLISKYTMDMLSHHKRSKNPDLCLEAISAMNFLQTYSKFSEASAKSFRTHLPEEIMHLELTPALLNI
ncbi:WASH complex subunit 5 [Coccinella septempunctata]|uniref:WASH complex subunit 5 n=1 Tax=Coccinella septempunctata TaxID=41139 RepID=UPI001D0749F6|nr:WASH complex subunit 5 [Coccinella septempunctata]